MSIKIKVQYFEKFNKRNKIDFSKTPKLIRLKTISFQFKKSKYSGVILSRYLKIKSHIWSKFQLLIYDFKMLNEIKQKYIMITLHVQPEASIDVVGSKYSNQIEFVDISQYLSCWVNYFGKRTSACVRK